MKRRAFFQSIVKAGLILALAPRIAFRAPKLEFWARAEGWSKTYENCLVEIEQKQFVGAFFYNQPVTA